MDSIPAKILLVEGSEAFASLISNSIAQMGDRFCLHIVRNLAEARSFLAEQIPDLMLVDLHLPDGSGTELLPGEGVELPFPAVLLTSDRSEDFSKLALNFGALDYQPLNPADLPELPHLVERTLRFWEQTQGRRKAEEALRRSEEKYRLLFENMTEALALDQIIYDDQGKAVDWKVIDINPAYEEILKIPREKAVGRCASELYSPSMDITPILETFARVAITGVPAQMELFFPWSQRYLLISVFALGEGRFATLSTDITERKEIEAARERLLAEMNATINSIAEAVIIYRPNGEIERINPAAERLLGYSEKDREKPLVERISRFRVETLDGRPFPLEQTMQRVFAGETLCGVLAVLHRPDGKTIWMSNSAAPIRSPEGKLLGAVGISTDITALHDLQEQRDQCLHTVSHDLRSPMTLIQGYAEIIQQRISEAGIDGDLAQNVEELLKGAQRMSSMIDDLVETARAEGGQIQLEKSPVRLKVLVDDLIRSYEKLLQPERMRIDIPDDFPCLHVDPARMERIFINLITNALKYSPPGSPIVLTARAAPETVRISISDSGPGIDPEDLPHIFERFYRGRGQRKADSVGLGLFITKMLVEAHGGRIEVESKGSGGSIFKIILPRPLEHFSPGQH